MVQIFLDYVTRLPRFQDTTNMSRQAAVCVALADCHCVPLFFMGQRSAMMQLCNQVIGDIKDTENYCSVMLNQTEVEHGKSTFFCFVCHFLGISAREKVRLGHSGKNWKIICFSRKIWFRERLFSRTYQFCWCFLRWRVKLHIMRYPLWDACLETSNSCPTFIRLGTFRWVAWMLHRDFSI